ncbi:MAG: sulfur carrier protein ThiS [Verrucomicrobia bacterium]|nr:sulfur carrier protein ThiS [Verrucomicrobiota bacterium]
MKKIQLNGEEKKVCASTLLKLLEELKLPIATVLVEQNGIALHRHELEKATLVEHDKIEILQIAAGG